jgi:hypothetical protein
MERKPKRRRQDTIKITFVTHSKSFYLWRERKWFLIHHVKYSLDDTLSYHQIPWYKCIQVQRMKCTLMYSFHLESLATTIFCLPSLSNPPWASPNTVAWAQWHPELMGHHTHAWCLARSQHLEAVWVRVIGCVFLKTQKTNVWLIKKKTVCCAWSHSQITYQTQKDKNQKNTVFKKFNHDTLFTEQCIMPPLFSEQRRHTPLFTEQWSMWTIQELHCSREFFFSFSVLIF